MKRILLIFVLPLLIFALIAHSTYWFIKSGEIKKNITKFIEYGSYATVGSISSSGFPFSHKFVINDINISIEDPVDGKGNIAINQVTIESSVFSSEYNVNLPGNISITNSKNQASLVTFNSVPNIKLFTDGFKIYKVSYADTGYNIVDESKNVVFSAGNSNLNITIEGKDREITSFKASFNNISSFNIQNFVEKLAPVAQNTDNKSQADTTTSEVTSVETNLKNTPVTTTTTTTTVSETQKDEKIPALPEVITPAQDPIAQAPKLEVLDIQNLNLNVDLVFKSNKANQLTDLTINNLEIASPLYTIITSGHINFLDEKNPNFNLNVKVQNFPNASISLKQFIANIVPADLQTLTPAEPEIETITLDKDGKPVISPENTTTLAANTEKAAKEKVKVTEKTKTTEKTPTSQTVKTTEKTTEIITETPEVIVQPVLGDLVVTLISDIAKKNGKTNDTTAEFNIIFDNSKLTINNLNWDELTFMSKPVLDILLNIWSKYLISNQTILDPKIVDSLGPVEEINATKPVETLNENNVQGTTPQTQSGTTQPATNVPAIPAPPVPPAPTTNTNTNTPSKTPPLPTPATPIDNAKKKEVDFGNKMNGTNPSKPANKNQSPL